MLGMRVLAVIERGLLLSDDRASCHKGKQLFIKYCVAIIHKN